MVTRIEFHRSIQNRALAGVVVVLCLTSIVGAQSADYIFAATHVTGGPGAIVSVDITLEVASGASSVQAYSFGFGHDPEHIFVGATEGPDLIAMNGGSGPDYSMMVAAPGGWIAGVLFDFDLAVTISAGNTYLVHIAEYQLGTTTSTSSLEFLTLGSPAIDPLIVSTADQEVTPTLAAGSLTVSPFPSIVRGDCDGNGAVQITDPIAALEYLFLSGAGPCLDGCDANGNGALIIADPIYILGYLFLSGPPPASPFPNCAPTPPSLGCNSPACP